MQLNELDTPSLLVDLEKLESNISTMASLAKKQGVALRPHTKTHKCPEIAKMQLDAGASGITCAKIGEAEVMADAGIEDILIANEIIGDQKLRRLIELAKKVRLCVALDGEFGAKNLNQVLEEANESIDVMIEINCGQNRCGVLPGEPALRLAKTITDLHQINLRGLLTHGGHAYNQKTENGIREVGLNEGRVMVETAQLLRKNGIEVDEISVGSTPAAKYCSQVEGVTEIRPGTYVFNDLTQVKLFSCSLKNCALSVLATVISRPAKDRVVVDAGKKALTSDSLNRDSGDGGYGLICDKDVYVTRLSEEHGIIETEVDFEIGEKVRIIPNHACVVVNMFDEMFGISNGQVEKSFKIEGRGKVQ